MLGGSRSNGGDNSGGGASSKSISSACLGLVWGRPGLLSLSVLVWGLSVLLFDLSAHVWSLSALLWGLSVLVLRVVVGSRIIALSWLPAVVFEIKDKSAIFHVRNRHVPC